MFRWITSNALWAPINHRAGWVITIRVYGFAGPLVIFGVWFIRTIVCGTREQRNSTCLVERYANIYTCSNALSLIELMRNPKVCCWVPNITREFQYADAPRTVHSVGRWWMRDGISIRCGASRQERLMSLYIWCAFGHDSGRGRRCKYEEYVRRTTMTHIYIHTKWLSYGNCAIFKYIYFCWFWCSYVQMTRRIRILEWVKVFVMRDRAIEADLC